MGKVWYACEEHIDPVLDKIVDEYARAPDLIPLSTSDQEQGPGCHWCGKKPNYRLQLSVSE
ncbi:MAG: CxxH/CxxC protein [Firmicutes bacterium]|uniref:CxxH/CxxC protein n=1 Tax=Melghirimyces thermohalophilus TaxID=1236220 RepID=UPI0015A17FF6|nr:CxxH/CxxC protein [Melghirimyces thermohalophilus]MDA8351991.1 CxxH/CxxC protein [Bacillota bacterium]